VVIPMLDEFWAICPLNTATTERFSMPFATAVNLTEAPEVVLRLPSEVLFSDHE